MVGERGMRLEDCETVLTRASERANGRGGCAEVGEGCVRPIKSSRGKGRQVQSSTGREPSDN